MTTVEVIHVLALAYAALAAATLAVVFYDEVEDQEGGAEEISSVVNGILEEVEAVKRVRKRMNDGSIDGASTTRKRTKKEYDYNGAWSNIQRDYLGDSPLFCSQFERIFRITPGIFDRVLSSVAGIDPFFTYTWLPFGLAQFALQSLLC